MTGPKTHSLPSDNSHSEITRVVNQLWQAIEGGNGAKNPAMPAQQLLGPGGYVGQFQAVTGIASKASQTASDAAYAATVAGQAAAAAQAQADAANAALANIASDSIISPGEKSQVFNDWKALYDEHTGIDAQATSYGVTTPKSDYDTAWTNLQTYLNASPISMQNPPTDGSAWCSDLSNIAITGTTFRTNFATVYSTRQTLLSTIYGIAKSLANAAAGTATWGGIGGTLSNQTDLQNALNAKANLSGAAFTGPISGTSASFINVRASGGGDNFVSSGGAAGYAFYTLATGNSARWRIGKNTDTESGGNAGSSLGFWAYNDDGSYAGLWLNIRRSDGTFWFAGPAGYINGSPILTLANAGTNAATLQAAVANATAPMVGTLAQMNAYSVPSGTTPYWYATDITAPDGQPGTLYHWTGSAWVSVGNPSAVIGRVTAGVISTGAIGAQALAATIGLLSIIQSVPYNQGTSTAAPTGFKLSGTAYTATCYNGDTTGGTAVTRTVYLELGSGVSLGGYYVGDLILGRLVNAGTMSWTTPGTYYWRCPPGIYSVTVTLQGAGASGVYILGKSSNNFGGGGAGAYIRTRCSVTPGTLYPIVVGAGGASVTTTNTAGNDGGDTTFNSDDGAIKAGGGHGGTRSAGGTGGSVKWAKISSSAAKGQTGGTYSQPGNVVMASGGMVIGACGGPSGAWEMGQMGGTPLWPSANNGNAGTGANSSFGLGGVGAMAPSASAYGAGGAGANQYATQSGAGAGGFAMLEW